MSDGKRGMAELLREKGFLKDYHVAAVQAMVDARLRDHGGDAQRSLAAFGGAVPRTPGDLEKTIHSAAQRAGGATIEVTAAAAGAVPARCRTRPRRRAGPIGAGSRSASTKTRTGRTSSARILTDRNRSEWKSSRPTNRRTACAGWWGTAGISAWVLGM